MNCSEARPLLDLLGDDALDAKDSALLLDHMQLCPVCHREWEDAEKLRSLFRDAKGKPQMRAGLMPEISQKLGEIERENRNRSLANSVPWMAAAATILVIGLFLLSWIHQFQIGSPVLQTASAETLIEDLGSEGLSTPVNDRTELSNRLGYDLKFVRLPEWQMKRLAVYRTRTMPPIARMDFVRSQPSGKQHLTCYQAPEGMILANKADAENVGSKRVLFGTHDKLQFALWSENGRDYLFVTALPKAQLEDVLRRT